MARQRIAVTIGADGKISAATLGITGKECLEYIPLLEELLDAEVVESAFTAEYAVQPVGTVEAATETVHEQRP